MTFQYQNYEEDIYVWYHAYLTKTVPGRLWMRNWRIRVAVAYPIVVLALSFFSFPILKWYGFVTALSFTVLAVIYHLVMGHGTVRDARRLAKIELKRGSLAPLLGPRETTITPEELRTNQSTGTNSMRWTEETRFEEAEEYFYIHWTPALFSQIPKRAFASDADRGLFRTQVEQYILMAKGKPLPAIAVNTAGQNPWYQDRNNVETGTNTQRQP